MANGRNRKRVFCEFAFLKKFRSANGHLSPFDSADAFKNWIAVSEYIQKTHLLLDVDKATFYNNIRTGDAIFKLIKRSTEGYFKVDYTDTHGIKDVDFYIWRPEGIASSYLLTKKSAVCQHYRKSYGVNVLTPDCWTDNRTARDNAFYFRDCGSTVDKEERISWREIFRGEYQLCNCNTMIIIDNYIEKDMERNLFAILDSLLPESLYQIDFHLTILTERADGRTKESYKEEYRKISDHIKKIRPKLKCHLELYVPEGKSNFHDRTIITNNVMINCGAGFNLLNNSGKARNNTKVEITYPYLQGYSDTCDLMYEKTINDVRTEIDKIDDSIRYGAHWPEERLSINRLIRM